MPAPRTHSRTFPVARGLTLFFGVLCVINVIQLLGPRGFDSSLWWIDLRFLPPPLRAAWLSAAAATLLAWVMRPRRAKLFALTILSLLASIACRDVIRYYLLLARGSITSTIPIPVSAFVALALGWILFSVVRYSSDVPTPAQSDLPTAGPPGRIGRRWTQTALIMLTICICALTAPLLQMLAFGNTDYRRRADAIIVPGARTHADGRPSQALADRVQTACRLYHEGYAPTLIFSGGPGDGAVSEVQAMRTLALQNNVPDSAIVLDEQGLNTAATAQNAIALLRARGLHRALLVTHFYHTARAKIAFQRDGFDISTVPAHCDRTLTKLPIFMAREAAALWVYYLGPLVK